MTEADRATVEAARGVLSRFLKTNPVISSFTALQDYCATLFANSQIEQIHVLYLDRKNRLIEDWAGPTGTVDHCPVYPREVVKRALEVGASAMIVTHNHPSGDPTPSQDDIRMTSRIIAASDPLGITVHDHLIVGAGGADCSMKAAGLLT